MAEKKVIKVLIGGKVMTMSGYESEEYMQRVASYINSKIEEYDRYQNPLRQIFLKVRDFILTCLYLFVFIEILLAVYVAM